MVTPIRQLRLQRQDVRLQLRELRQTPVAQRTRLQEAQIAALQRQQSLIFDQLRDIRTGGPITVSQSRERREQAITARSGFAIVSRSGGSSEQAKQRRRALAFIEQNPVTEAQIAEAERIVRGTTGSENLADALAVVLERERMAAQIAAPVQFVEPVAQQRFFETSRGLQQVTEGDRPRDALREITREQFQTRLSRQQAQERDIELREQIGRRAASRLTDDEGKPLFDLQITKSTLPADIRTNLPVITRVGLTGAGSFRVPSGATVDPSRFDLLPSRLIRPEQTAEEIIKGGRLQTRREIIGDPSGKPFDFAPLATGVIPSGLQVAERGQDITEPLVSLAAAIRPLAIREEELARQVDIRRFQSERRAADFRNFFGIIPQGLGAETMPRQRGILQTTLDDDIVRRPISAIGLELLEQEGARQFESRFGLTPAQLRQERQASFAQRLILPRTDQRGLLLEQRRLVERGEAIGGLKGRALSVFGQVGEFNVAADIGVRRQLAFEPETVVVPLLAVAGGAFVFGSGAIALTAKFGAGLAPKLALGGKLASVGIGSFIAGRETASIITAGRTGGPSAAGEQFGRSLTTRAVPFVAGAAIGGFAAREAQPFILSKITPKFDIKTDVTFSNINLDQPFPKTVTAVSQVDQRVFVSRGILRERATLFVSNPAIQRTGTATFSIQETTSKGVIGRFFKPPVKGTVFSTTEIRDFGSFREVLASGVVRQGTTLSGRGVGVRSVERLRFDPRTVDIKDSFGNVVKQGKALRGTGDIFSLSPTRTRVNAPRLISRNDLSNLARTGRQVSLNVKEPTDLKGFASTFSSDKAFQNLGVSQPADFAGTSQIYTRQFLFRGPRVPRQNTLEQGIANLLGSKAGKAQLLPQALNVQAVQPSGIQFGTAQPSKLVPRRPAPISDLDLRFGQGAIVDQINQGIVNLIIGQAAVGGAQLSRTGLLFQRRQRPLQTERSRLELPQRTVLMRRQPVLLQPQRVLQPLRLGQVQPTLRLGAIDVGLAQRTTQRIDAITSQRFDQRTDLRLGEPVPVPSLTVPPFVPPPPIVPFLLSGGTLFRRTPRRSKKPRRRSFVPSLGAVILDVRGSPKPLFGAGPFGIFGGLDPIRSRPKGLGLLQL